MTGIPPSPVLQGYHGTDKANAAPISLGNFHVGSAPEWLGIGAYFFVEGISCDDPPDDAKNWALFWAKGRYTRWSVMTAKISAAKLLDLTDRATLKLFNKYRKACRRRFGAKVPAGYLQGRSGLDILVLETMIKSGKIDAAKGDFYTQFNQETHQIPSRLPNATLLCVYRPELAIDLASIKEHSTGLIT